MSVCWVRRALGARKLGCMAYLVLDLSVAPRWGHILRHCDGNERVKGLEG